MNLLSAIRKHLSIHRMAPTRFGREAVGDPRFVADLASGRRPRPATVARVEAFIADREARR